MSLADIDSHFIKCIGFMHSSSLLSKDDIVPLQDILEEAITIKSGVVKDLTPFVEIDFKQERIDDYKTITPVYEGTPQNSDNELDELDLLKEDLMCIVCKGMDVGARNRLLECCDCHALYHQECHKPPVTAEDAFGSWTCQNCKDARKKIKQSVSNSISSDTSSNHSSSTMKSNSTTINMSSNTSSSSKSKSSSNRSSSSSYKSSSSKSSSDKYKSSISSNTRMKSVSSSSSSRSTISPNINIISADKRIQIMKKKAAKQQEKKKQLPR